jgi:gamma-glutamylcyclotransferase (GGCT)/AIG2-like uncharacterized protein YtfP
MKSRCPQSRKIGASVLREYQLLFRSHNGRCGYLTIEKSAGSVVPIAIYEVSENDITRLDRYEGVHNNLYRKEEIELSFNNANITGLVYIMNKNVPLLPEDKYFVKVMQGYVESNFDINILMNAYNECKQKLLDGRTG